MRKHLAGSLLTLGLAGSSLLLVAPAQATHSWGGYHWARASTFSLQLGDNVDGTWQKYYDNSILDWSTVVDDPATTVSPTQVLTLTGVAGSTTGKRCRASSGRVEVCNAAYGRTGWLGLAQIWLTGPHITQGTAKVNDTYFSMSRYDNPDQRQHVLCQEVGHTFGLGHTSEDGSVQKTCMDYSTDPSSTKPNEHDFEQLGTIYGHPDATTTVASSAARSGLVADERASWGREEQRSADGHQATFVRDLGGGQRLVTHVIWADDPRGEQVAHTH